MPLVFPEGSPAVDHPITGLQYDVEVRSVVIEGRSYQIKTLRNVEGSIDLVFDWLDRHGLSVNEIEHLAPYFGTIWPSALALAQAIAKLGERGQLRDRTFLEIGCGLGLPGLVAAHYGAVVTLSDGHPDVPRFLAANISLNGDPDIRYVSPHWQTGASALGQFDFVVGSDILYEPQHALLFSQVLTQHAHTGSKVLVADPGRAYIQQFTNRMKDAGWVEELEPWRVPHLGKAADIYLLKFVRGS